MVDTRRRDANPFADDNGYGDPPRGAVGFRGTRGREYEGGYGSDADEFRGGTVDDGRHVTRDDAGFARPSSGHSSGYGAFGHVDRNDRSDRGGDRRAPSNHRGRGPKGYQRSDERIREEVCERLTDDPFIDASDVEVAVNGREVRLSGTVASRGLRRRAEDLVEMVSGVAHVQNDLRIAGDP